MIFLLPHIIDSAAERFPEKEALRFYDQSLTYAELVQRSNSLARALRAQGVKRRDRVGIYLNKGFESVIAMYGILKAGAAYVPLDPSAPIIRLTYVIQDCGIRHLITQEGKRDAVQQISAGTELECVIGMQSLDLPIRSIPWDEVFNTPDATVPDMDLIEQDLAYIFYTSGSTGEPKGIMHTHHSGLSYAKWATQVYSLHHEDRLSSHAPLHFDMSTFEFFAGLLAGTAIEIIPEEVMKLPASYSKLLADKKISVFFTVPFMLTQLLLRGALHARDLSAIRWVIFGGDTSSTKHVRALMTQLPQARFSHMYGPAETNGCTYYNISSLPDKSDAPIPIGKVCPNMEGLVVNEDNQPVAPDGVGELLIRSPTMMQGYWGRPDLNERAFFRRPVFANYEDVFYRTGDLVQLLLDGNLKFVGRKDRQIKTRGYRVELDEIEVALLSHDGVEETAVFPIADGEGSHRIEAAVTLKDRAMATSSDLGEHLKDRLPWYAIPSKIAIVDGFPRTSSGKIDRRELQRRAQPEIEAQTEV